MAHMHSDSLLLFVILLNTANTATEVQQQWIVGERGGK